jgi:quercetin dioxygenase-like cupin family protein
MTLRDLFVAALASMATAGAMSLVQTAPGVMGSRAVEWSEMEARPTKAGESRQVFRAPTATLDELELHVTTLQPGQSPHEPHQHPHEEVIIIREGTVETLLGERTRRVGPGSVIFQASNQLHGIRNVGDVPAVYHVISWKAGPRTADR